LTASVAVAMHIASRCGSSQNRAEKHWHRRTVNKYPRNALSREVSKAFFWKCSSQISTHA